MIVSSQEIMDGSTRLKKEAALKIKTQEIRQGLSALIVCALMTMTSIASAQDFAQGARPVGMGEAFNSISTGAAGVYHNPAGIARAILYAVEGSYSYTPTGNLLSLAIVDSKTNPSVSAGFAVSYYFDRNQENSDITALDLRLPIAIPIVPERISVGLGIRYLSINDTDIETLSGFTLDAGAMFRVADALHIGVSAKNLLETCDVKSRCQGIAPLTIGGGVAFEGGTEFVVAADVDADLTSADSTKVNFAIGGEYLIQSMIPVRLGYKRRGIDNGNVLTLGSGWRSPTAGIDAGYQHVLSSDSDDSGVGLITVGVSVYF